MSDPKPDMPLIYLHCFDELPGNVPPQASLMDWSEWFDRSTTPRRVPAPSAWQERLLPALIAQRKIVNQEHGRGLVHLQSSGALTAGFAFGHTFQAVGRYRLAVSQSTQGNAQSWRSDEPPPAGCKAPRFHAHRLEGDPNASDGVVIVHALARPLDSIVRDVGRYLEEKDLERLVEITGQPLDPDDASQQQTLIGLRELLDKRFDKGELDDLCFRLGVKYDDLPGEGRSSKALKLVDYMNRRGRISELVAIGQNLRPDVPWPTIPKVGARCQRFKGILVLDARLEQGRLLEGWQAAAMARASQGQVADFVSRARPGKLHLFLATPFSLAVFLGHQWNAVNARVQCYEWVKGEVIYAPACLLQV
jgi:hypothetical protein